MPDHEQTTTPDPAPDGCGCQYDAAGRRFRTRCICPPPMTTEQTLRAVAGLGSTIGDGVAELLAERDELRAELARVRPVVDAARAWRDSPSEDSDSADALLDAVAALDGDAAATPQPAGRELLAFVEDTERRLPLLREPDPDSDWSRGVAWTLDRARAAVRALATPTTDTPGGDR